VFKRVKCFRPRSLWTNLKTQQPLVILELCLRKTRSGKSRDFPIAIVSKKHRWQNVFREYENEKQGVFKFLRFEEHFRKAS